MSRNDLVLDDERARAFLEEDVVVEEKLDGASVAIWLGLHDSVRVATRGGAAARDRAGQRGPLRRWASERTASLSTLLHGGWVLYAEWLWFAHGIRYRRLPDWLIGLDLWHDAHGFLPLAERDRRLDAAAIPLPPRLFAGSLGSRPRLEQLAARSAYGDDPAEGVVVRRVAPEGPRCAKCVRAGFRQRSDAEWLRPLCNGRMPVRVS